MQEENYSLQPNQEAPKRSWSENSEPEQLGMGRRREARGGGANQGVGMRQLRPSSFLWRSFEGFADGVLLEVDILKA
ncbi:hypothetical protein SLE2022_287520 [Rubroshorea leprosula]